MTTQQRERVNSARVGYDSLITIPVVDGDGADQNLDGLTLASTVKDPAGNYYTYTPVIRAVGSNLMDITVLAADLTTGGAGEWELDATINARPVHRGQDIAGHVFTAIAKETEA